MDVVKAVEEVIKGLDFDGVIVRRWEADDRIGIAWKVEAALSEEAATCSFQSTSAAQIIELSFCVYEGELRLWANQQLYPPTPENIFKELYLLAIGAWRTTPTSGEVFSPDR